MDTVRVKGKEHTREEEFVSVAQVIAGPVIAIKAMVCRRWDSTNAFGKYLSTEYLLSDAEGNMIHCTSRSNNSHRVITLVEEGSVYSFKNFKDKFRNHKDDLHILSLKGYIVVNRLSCPTDGFIRFPFHSTELEKIEPNGSAYLIDVIGIVINMGKIRSTKAGSGLLDCEIMNESIMEGEKSHGQFSTEIMIRDKRSTKASSLLSPIILFHGTDNSSIP